MQIETIAACNMSCRFCPYPLKEDKRSILPSDVVYSVLDEINPMQDGFEYITFSQFNEPLLDRRIFDFVACANDKSIPVLFITNGLLLSKPSIRLKLLQAAPAQIKISIQTLNQSAFLSLRGTTTSFEEYIGGIAAFLSDVRGASSDVTMDVACNFLATEMRLIRTILGLTKGDPSVPSSIKAMRKSTEAFITEIMRLTSNLFVRGHDLAEFLRFASPDYVSERGLRLAENIRLKIKPFMYGRRIAEFYPASHSISCRNRMLGILADGSVVPCCLIYGSNLALGNVRDKSLHDILEDADLILRGLRGRSSSQPLICRKCLGQPTRRGVIVHKILDGLGLV